MCSLTPVEYQETFRPILPAESLTATQGMAVEAIFTFNTTLVVLSVTSRQRAHPIPGLPIAMCVGAAILSAVCIAVH